MKDSNLRQSFGLSLKAYEAILARQGGLCAICRKPPDAKRRAPVDHDHVTGKVRGILCAPCNLILGHAKDDPERLRAAAAYLEWTKLAEPTYNDKGELIPWEPPAEAVAA